MINCTDVDIPENFTDFLKLMVKHKSEGNTLLVNINEHWHTAEIRNIDGRSRAVNFIILGYDTIYVYDGNYEREYRNLFRNSTYVIEDMFYRIANAHS